MYCVIGGGIFGSYAALWLSRQGKKVILLEKEARLFSKASVVNQARLHGGYHYPRSVATALMSDDNKARFTQEHKQFVNTTFEKYYAIDRNGSFTDSQQFERFCDYLNIRCERVKVHSLFNFDRIESLYATTEYSFDPYLVANYYQQQLENEDNITILCNSHIVEAIIKNGVWEITYSDNGNIKTLQASNVINATYAASNVAHEQFGLPPLRLMHEISEMAFVTSPQVQNIGLTIMDGPFGSLMPYGKSGLLSLSSVAYTHHKVSYAHLPTFDCQKNNTNCTPQLTSNCNACTAKPMPNHRKMMSQMLQYFNENVRLNYFNSLFTIKTKLQSNAIDDGRPTEIACLHQNPGFYTIFAGKINSIYEIEKLVL